MFATLNAQSGPLADVNWAPIVVAFIALLGTVIVALMNARTDDLKRAERLTGLLEKMDPGPERAFVERIRDDHVVRWTFRVATPKYNSLRVMVVYAWILAVLSFAFGTIYSVSEAPSLVGPVSTWCYLAFVVFFIAANALHAKRRARQQKWVEAERRNRSIEPPQNRRLRLEYEDRSTADEPRPVQRWDGDQRRS